MNNHFSQYQYLQPVTCFSTKSVSALDFDGKSSRSKSSETADQALWFGPSSSHSGCYITPVIKQRVFRWPPPFFLVGGWTNPFEKYESNWIISPSKGNEDQKCLKPPPSFSFPALVFQQANPFCFSQVFENKKGYPPGNSSTYTTENQHDIGKSPSGNTSSNHGVFIVMLVFRGVIPPQTGEGRKIIVLKKCRSSTVMGYVNSFPWRVHV